VAIPRRSIVRAVAVCRACRWSWKPTTGLLEEACPSCGKRKSLRVRGDTRDNLVALKAWRARNPGYATFASRAIRRTASLLVGKGKMQCVRCGCDMDQLLEINHKNGGGQKDLRGRSQQFYRDIALHRRDVDDLELLCKPCNSVHALELVHGPLPFRVVWRGE
jgi:predicted RNA-binding Zn-ribbon protein involved in translation (DUF1610 family)